MTAAKKLNLKQKYQYLTRNMDWEPSYQKKSDNKKNGDGGIAVKSND